jgi:hypothetical protein
MGDAYSNAYKSVCNVPVGRGSIEEMYTGGIDRQSIGYMDLGGSQGGGTDNGLELMGRWAARLVPGSSWESYRLTGKPGPSGCEAFDSDRLMNISVG